MDQQQLEIARLHAKLAVAKGELKLAKAPPKGDRSALPGIILGLGFGAGVGFGLGFMTTGAPFPGQEFAQMGSAFIDALR